VSLAGTSIPAAALEAAVLRCQRDAPELELRVCIERHQVPRWRLDREADRLFAADSDTRRAVEANVLSARLFDSLLDSGTPSEAAISTYLAEHTAEWQRPERVRVFRILVSTREEAEALLQKLSHATIAEFRTEARAHSLDKTSHERGGDLGFVAPDGTTDVPALRVDPALFEAASTVADGAFVARPVPEGDRFAVVWRRGSLPARHLSEADARAWASAELRESHAARELERLLAAQPVERHPDLLARFRRDECRLFAR